MRVLVVLLALVAVSAAMDRGSSAKSDDRRKESREGSYHSVEHKKEAYRKSHPPKKQCYQCAYSPPTITYTEVKVPHETRRKVKVEGKKRKYKWVTDIEYEVKQVPKTTAGGWGKCSGSFTERQARYWGIDTWDCDGNCYYRKEDNGNVFRGCYTGTFGVDQTKLGCSKQAGSLWCFCAGSKCNNREYY